MGRNYLAHASGDAINAVLAAAGYNFRRRVVEVFVAQNSDRSKHCTPTRYQVYEIDDDWLSWIAKTYPLSLARRMDSRSSLRSPIL
jgi:hypothetical protein